MANFLIGFHYRLLGLIFTKWESFLSELFFFARHTLKNGFLLPKCENKRKNSNVTKQIRYSEKVRNYLHQLEFTALETMQLKNKTKTFWGRTTETVVCPAEGSSAMLCVSSFSSDMMWRRVSAVRRSDIRKEQKPRANGEEFPALFVAAVYHDVLRFNPNNLKCRILRGTLLNK